MGTPEPLGHHESHRCDAPLPHAPPTTLRHRCRSVTLDDVHHETITARTQRGNDTVQKSQFEEAATPVVIPPAGAHRVGRHRMPAPPHAQRGRAAVLAVAAGLWLYIDTHADRLAASTEGAHDYGDLT